MNDTDERHPNCHTLGALKSDPAKRLAVNITIPKTQGEPAEQWITTTGDKNVLRVNSIVDRMDEVPEEGSRRTARRYFLQGKSGGYYMAHDDSSRVVKIERKKRGGERTSCVWRGNIDAEAMDSAR